MVQEYKAEMFDFRCYQNIATDWRPKTNVSIISSSMQKKKEQLTFYLVLDLSSKPYPSIAFL